MLLRRSKVYVINLMFMRNIIIKFKRLFCQCAAINRFDSDVFVPPFRLGRRQKRAILDARGREVIIMPHNSEKQAQMYCDYLNGLYYPKGGI